MNPPFTRNPADIPLEVLRGFVREQALLHTYRGLAERWGMGHETLRKFISGVTVQPHPRQRERYGALFLHLHPAGYVAENGTDHPDDDRPRPLPRLKRLLPPDRDEAAEALDRIFALAGRHPDELPEQADAVREWMRTLLDAEFRAEAQYARGRRPPREGEEMI
jgi:hypothetical protein